jgi:hypothetical protein
MKIPVEFTATGVRSMGVSLGGGFYAYRAPGDNRVLLAFYGDRALTQEPLATTVVPSEQVFDLIVEPSQVQDTPSVPPPPAE